MSTTVSTIAKVATFFRGLISMMPFQLCMVGSSFAMKRFGYEEEAVPIFVAFCSNAMEIFYLFGCLSTAIMITLVKTVSPSLFNYMCSGMSMVSACFTVVVNFLLLRTCALDDDVDNVTKYYWLLLVANFAAGVDLSCIFTLSADDLSPYELGYNTGGIVLVGFHWIVIQILEIWRLDVNYWLIVLQLVFMVVLSSAAAVVWVWFLIQDKIMHSSGYTVSSSSSSSRGGDGIKSNPLELAIGFAKCLPMVLGFSIGLGYLWGIYPYISPYQVTPFEYHYPIQRLCLVARATSGFINFFLGQYGGVRSDWYKYPYAWWHLLWLFYIPFLGIGILFLHCMHYPESVSSRIVLRKPSVIGFLTVIFYIMGRVTQGTSSTAIAMNAGDNLKEIISPLNQASSIITTNVLKYMAEAHVQQFKLAKEGVKAGKAWPTDGMSKHSAIRHWIRIAATLGYVNFRDLATADVKQRLGSVPRHIVSYRRLSSVP